MKSKIALLFLLTLATYANVLYGEFVFDDAISITQNQNVRSLSKSLEEPRPLTALTYAIDYKVGGLDPFVYKATNILIHAINSVLVLLILETLFGGAGVHPFAGAALFVVHPVFLQAVGYVAGRSSLLCGMFYFSAIFCFLEWMHPRSIPSLKFMRARWPIYKSPMQSALYWEKRLSLGWLALGVICSICAWYSKQEAIALPFFLFGLYALLGGRYVKGAATCLILLAIVCYASLAPTLDTVAKNQELIVAGFDPVLSWSAYVPTYTVALISYYYSKFLMPTDLSVDPMFRVVWARDPSFWAALGIIGALIWLYLLCDKQAKAGLMALLISPLTVYALVPMQDPIQGHRAYIAGLGVIILVATVLKRIPWRSAQWLVTAALVTTLGISTVKQNERWNTAVTLWEQARTVNPLKARVHLNLGYAYQDRQRFRDALESYKRAVIIKPELWAAWSNIATIYMDFGDLKAAEVPLQNLVERAPRMAEGLINLGVLRMRQHRYDESIALQDRALEVHPGYLPALANRTLAIKLKEKNEN